MSVAKPSGPIQLVRRLVVHSLIVLSVLPCLLGCASSEQTRERQAAAQNEEDEAQCTASGAAPGTPAYDDCRGRLTEARAKKKVIDYQKREAFQRTLGEGTSAASGH